MKRYTENFGHLTKREDGGDGHITKTSGPAVHEKPWVYREIPQQRHFTRRETRLS